MAGAALARAFRGLPWHLLNPILREFRLALLEDYFEALGLEQTTILPLVFGLPRVTTADRNLTVLALSGVRAEYRTLSEVHPIVVYSLLRQRRFVGSLAEMEQVDKFCRPIFGLSMYHNNPFYPMPELISLLRNMTYQDFLSHFETEDIAFRQKLSRWMQMAGRAGNMQLVADLYRNLRGPENQEPDFAGQLTLMTREAPEEYTQFLLQNNLLELQTYDGEDLRLIERALAETQGDLAQELQFELGYYQRLGLIRTYRNILSPDYLLFGLLCGGYQGPFLAEFAAGIQEPGAFLASDDFPLIFDLPLRATDLPANWPELMQQFPAAILQLTILAAMVGRVDVVEIVFGNPTAVATFDNGNDEAGTTDFLALSGFYVNSILESPVYRRLVAEKSEVYLYTSSRRAINRQVLTVIPAEKLRMTPEDLPLEVVVPLVAQGARITLGLYLEKQALRPEFNRSLWRDLLRLLKVDTVGQWVLRRELFELLPSREFREEASVYILLAGTPENRILPVGQQYSTRADLLPYVNGTAFPQDLAAAAGSL